MDWPATASPLETTDLVWWCYPIAEIASLGVTMLFFLRVYRTVIAKVPLDGAPSLEEQEAEQ